MSGWKTKLGGTGLIFTGLGLIIGGLLSEPISGEMLASGFTSLFLGWAGLGLGHKIEKAAK